MSELALYRKYRPGSFGEIVGQEHVVSVLKSAAKNGKISHAYLFSGSRGTGKTSLARIFSAALGVSQNDIFEIDAASNRGIDEIRELREAVHTLPFESPFKVYIIDEVHMLTKEAFNALLKTLEEPPPHVIFILATTEAHKLPETIISRCQSFSFKKPTDDDIKKVLERIVKEEKYKIDKESLSLLAFLGDGSYRDAIGNLQKVITVSTDKKIMIDEVEKITGAPRKTLVHSLMSAMLDGDLERGLSEVQAAAGADIDIKIFVKMMLRELRFTMLLLYAPDLELRIAEDLSKEEIAFLKELGKKPRANLMSAMLKELLLAYGEVDRAYIKQLPLELALVKIIGQNTQGK